MSIYVRTSTTIILIRMWPQRSYKMSTSLFLSLVRNMWSTNGLNGEPEDCCRVVKPGDKLRIKDLEIIVTDSFDRSALISDPNRRVQPPMNVVPDDMDKRVVNYVIKTDAGTFGQRPLDAKITCLRKPKLGLKLTPFGIPSFKRLS